MPGAQTGLAGQRVEILMEVVVLSPGRPRQ